MIPSFAQLTGKILLTTLLALLLAGSAMAKPSGKVLAKGILLKDGKTGYVQASATKPTSLSVSIATTPAVKVKIQYSVICTSGGASSTSADGEVASTTPLSGTLSAMTPSVQKLKLPFAHPATCSLTVYTTLPKKGPKETLELIAG